MNLRPNPTAVAELLTGFQPGHCPTIQGNQNAMRTTTLLIGILTLSLFTAACDFSAPTAISQACAQNNEAIKAQSYAQAANITAQEHLNHDLALIQKDVAKRCADRGFVPVFAQGNVGCIAAPK